MGKVIPLLGRLHPSRQQVVTKANEVNAETKAFSLPQNDLIGPLRDAGLIIDSHGYTAYAIEGLTQEQKQTLGSCSEEVANICLQIWSTNEHETSR